MTESRSRSPPCVQDFHDAREEFYINCIYLKTESHFAQHSQMWPSRKQVSLWTDGACGTFEKFKMVMQVVPAQFYEQRARQSSNYILLDIDCEWFFCFPLRQWKRFTQISKYSECTFFLYVACVPEDAAASGRIFCKIGYKEFRPEVLHDIVGYLERKSPQLTLCDNPNACIYICPLPSVYQNLSRPEISAEDDLKDTITISGAVLSNSKQHIDPHNASREWFLFGHAHQSMFTTYTSLQHLLNRFSDIPLLPFQATQDTAGKDRRGWRWLTWPWRCHSPWWWWQFTKCATNFTCHVTEDSPHAKLRRAGLLRQGSHRLRRSYTAVYDASAMRLSHQWMDDLSSANCTKHDGAF